MSVYRTVAYWRTHTDGHTPDPITETHPDLPAAEHSGMHWGCLTGIRRVEVFAPDGTLESLWDKETTEQICTVYGTDAETGKELVDVEHMSSRWQRLGNESQTLGRTAIPST